MRSVIRNTIIIILILIFTLGITLFYASIRTSFIDIFVASTTKNIFNTDDSSRIYISPGGNRILIVDEHENLTIIEEATGQVLAFEKKDII